MEKEIFQPFTAHNFKAKNRLVRSATWENLATPEGGICKNSYELYDELTAGELGDGIIKNVVLMASAAALCI